MPKYWFDEYGIFISPEPIDPQNPSGSGVYALIMELKSGETPSWVVHKWNALNRSSRTVLNRGLESDYFIQLPRIFNRFRITRTGDTITFWISHQSKASTDWKSVHSFTDSNLPSTFYVGVYAQHSKDDLGNYVIEFQYDYVDLSAWP